MISELVHLPANIVASPHNFLNQCSKKLRMMGIDAKGVFLSVNPWLGRHELLVGTEEGADVGIVVFAFVSVVRREVVTWPTKVKDIAGIILSFSWEVLSFSTVDLRPWVVTPGALTSRFIMIPPILHMSATPACS